MQKHPCALDVAEEASVASSALTQPGFASPFGLTVGVTADMPGAGTAAAAAAAAAAAPPATELAGDPLEDS